MPKMETQQLKEPQQRYPPVLSGVPNFETKDVKISHAIKLLFVAGKKEESRLRRVMSMYKGRSDREHQHQLKEQHAYQKTLRVDSLVASCVYFTEDDVSGMVICRITRCSSANGQAPAEDDMNSDTAWVERVVLLVKHTDGRFTWRSGAHSSTKVKLAFLRIILITPETVTACHEGDELSGVRYTFNNGDLDTK